MRISARLAITADISKLPPMPTPMIPGGHAFGPDSATACRTNSFAPSSPSAGFSIACLPMFSEPAPLASTWILIWSPGTIRVWMNAGVLSPVFLRSNSGSRTIDPRR